MISVLLAAGLLAPLGAQEAKPGDVKATVEVTVLSLDLLAVDRKDRPVVDLKADEIEVKVGGRVQTLEFFEPPPPPPAPGEPPPPRLAGTTLALEGEGRARKHLLFYLDVEGLSRDGLGDAVKAVGESLDRLDVSTRVSAVSHFGSAGRLVWEEVSLDRIRTEVERLVELLPAEEQSATASGPGFSGGGAGPVRSWEARRRRERDLVDALLRAASDFELRIAQRDIDEYLRGERLRAEQALEELRKTCEVFAELEGRKQIVLLSEGFERNPGVNFLNFLASARAKKKSFLTGGDGFASLPPTVTQLQAGSLNGLESFEAWIAASGISLHFVNPVQRMEVPTAEHRGAELVRNGSAEKFAFEEVPSRLAERTGGLEALTIGGLAPLLATVRSTYRVGVRLQGVEIGKPYKVSVTSKRKGVTVHHQSAFLKAPGSKSVAATEVAQADRALADTRRDDKREGAIRLTGPPIPLKIEWKGKARADAKHPGRSFYRAELVVPYADLKFVVAGDGLIANARLSLTAIGIGGTTGEDESTLDESPSFTGEEYRGALDRSLSRQVLLSLAPGKYRLSASVSDQIEGRSGAAQLDVVAAP